MDDEGDFSEEDELQRQMRMERMRIQREGIDANYDQGADMTLENVLDYEMVKGKLSEWVARSEVKNWIRRTFASFLRSFTDDHGQNVHEQRINDMCSMNK